MPVLARMDVIMLKIMRTITLMLMMSMIVLVLW
jgi:hypothetical protein